MFGIDQQQRLITLHRFRIQLPVGNHVDPVPHVAQTTEHVQPVIVRIIPPAHARIRGQQNFAFRHQHRHARQPRNRAALRHERFGPVHHRRETRKVEETIPPRPVRIGHAESRVIPRRHERSHHKEIRPLEPVRHQPPERLRELPPRTGVIVRLSRKEAVTVFVILRVVRQDAVVQVVQFVGAAVAVTILVDAVPSLPGIADQVCEHLMIERAVANARLHLDRTLRRLRDHGPFFRVGIANRLEIIRDELRVGAVLKPSPVEPRAGTFTAFRHRGGHRLGKTPVTAAPRPVQPIEIAVVHLFQILTERGERLRRIIRRQFIFVVDSPERDVVRVAFQHAFRRKRRRVEHIFPRLRVENGDLMISIRSAVRFHRILQLSVIRRITRTVKRMRRPEAVEVSAFVVAAVFLELTRLPCAEIVAGIDVLRDIQPEERELRKRPIAKNSQRKEVLRPVQFRRHLDRIGVNLLHRVKRGGSQPGDESGGGK